MTDSRNGANGRYQRGNNGRFIPGTGGGPGRPKGCANEASTLGRRLKALLVEHGLEPVASGDSEPTARILAALDRLYADDAAGYVAMLAKAMPKESAVELTNPHLDESKITGVNPEGKSVLERLKERLEAAPPNEL